MTVETEEKKGEVLTITERELLNKKLAKETEDLKIRRGNLETQIISLERQKESTQNIDNAKYQESRNRALQALANEKDAVSKERSEWHRRNERLNEQRQMMEKNEKTLGDVKTEMDRLQKERMEIYDLRKLANEMTRQAEEKFGEIEGFKESQEATKQDLESRIKVNEDKDKYYNDLIGEVEAREKAVKVREANCAALEMKYDKKEVKNEG